LTGEADDVLKDTETAPVLFSGSRVLEGMGRCIVIAVGPNSAQGQISGMVAGVESSGDELRSAIAQDHALPCPCRMARGSCDQLAAQTATCSCWCRQQTQLQKKLEVLAAQIGYVGLGAAGLSLAGMAVPFTYNTFFVQQQPWQWAFLTDYLHMLVQAITILVRGQLTLAP
jgi:P-type Ca2+ transporter type 2B